MCLVCELVGDACEPSISPASPATSDAEPASSLVTYLIGADEYRIWPWIYSCPNGAKMGEDPEDPSLSFLAIALLKDELSLFSSLLVDSGDCGIAPSIMGANEMGWLRSGPALSSDARRRMSVVAMEFCVPVDRVDPILRLRSVVAMGCCSSSSA